MGDSDLEKAGRLADRLRAYSNKRGGEPIVEDAADMIDRLVLFIRNDSDANARKLAHLRRFIDAWCNDHDSCE